MSSPHVFQRTAEEGEWECRRCQLRVRVTGPALEDVWDKLARAPLHQ